MIKLLKRITRQLITSLPERLLIDNYQNYFWRKNGIKNCNIINDTQCVVVKI